MKKLLMLIFCVLCLQNSMIAMEIEELSEEKRKSQEEEKWLFPREEQEELVTAHEIAALVPVIAQQWLDEYRNYPYLYKGTIEQATGYFNCLVPCSNAAVAIAHDKEENIIAFLSGAPFLDFAAHFVGTKELFENASLDPAQYYYFTDVIVSPKYRNQGIARKLFALLETHAQSLGYAFSCLASESHPDGHPQKPKDYKELGDLWQKFGYEKSALLFSFAWDTIQPDGTIKSQNHPLQYWIKKLRKNN